jgi:hypothetical protein
MSAFYDDAVPTVDWNPPTPIPTPVATKRYPEGNPKDAIGRTKPPLSSVVSAVALFHMGQAMQDGAVKYGPFNYREAGVAASVYIDAAQRHIAAWFDGGEELAEDSQASHLGHAMACLGIVLDCLENGNLIDDRPPPSKFPEMLKRFAAVGKAKADAAKAK